MKLLNQHTVVEPRRGRHACLRKSTGTGPPQERLSRPTGRTLLSLTPPAPLPRLGRSTSSGLQSPLPVLGPESLLFEVCLRRATAAQAHLSLTGLQDMFEPFILPARTHTRSRSGFLSLVLLFLIRLPAVGTLRGSEWGGADIPGRCPGGPPAALTPHGVTAPRPARRSGRGRAARSRGWRTAARRRSPGERANGDARGPARPAGVPDPISTVDPGPGLADGRREWGAPRAGLRGFRKLSECGQAGRLAPFSSHAILMASS